MRLAFVLAVLAGVLVVGCAARRRGAGPGAAASAPAPAPPPQATNIKIVYLASNLALSTGQLEALHRSVGEPDAVDHPLSPTDDGEQLHLVELSWPDERLGAHESATRLWLFQVPTNPFHIFTRTQILRGASFLVVIADGRLPVDDSTRWIEELREAHSDVLKANPRIIVQYVCPPGCKNDAAALKQALDPKGEFAELVFDTDDPEALASRTMQLIVDSIAATR